MQPTDGNASMRIAMIGGGTCGLVLPRVIDAMAAGGALRVNPIDDLPAVITGGRGQDDDRLEAVTGRRPMVEAAVASVAATTPGLTIHRRRTVTALTTAAGVGPPVHVSGVIVADEHGEEEDFAADLVVDASGRNSGLARLLTAAGAEAPRDESDDSGFVYLRETLRNDRFRLGEIEAAIEGTSYQTDDPFYRVLRAAEAAATLDPEVLRAWMDYFLMLRTGAEIFADDGLVTRVLELGSELDSNGPGPTRSELLALLGSSGGGGLA